MTSATPRPGALPEPSDLDPIVQANRRAKGKRPRFISDPAVERVLSITMAIAGELSVARKPRATSGAAPTLPECCASLTKTCKPWRAHPRPAWSNCKMSWGDLQRPERAVQRSAVRLCGASVRCERFNPRRPPLAAPQSAPCCSPLPARPVQSIRPVAPAARSTRRVPRET